MTTAATTYTDPRAHELRAEYPAGFSGDEIPVPVESIAEDHLGLRIEERDREREANVLGAELLMPEDAVREAWAEARDPAEVAERFGVSALAAQWRLYSFGLAERPA